MVDDGLNTLEDLRIERDKCRSNINWLTNLIGTAQWKGRKRVLERKLQDARSYEASLQRRIARRERAERI